MKKIYPEHLYEDVRIDLAISQLQKELRKLFPSFDEDQRRLMDGSIQGWLNSPADYNLSSDVAIRDFWDSVAAVFEGIKLKPTFTSLLTAKNYTWKKTKLSIDNLTTGTKLAQLEELEGFSQNNHRFLMKDLREYFETHSDQANKQLSIVQSHSSDEDQNAYPIIVYIRKGKHRIADGHRRSLLALLSGESEIETWLCNTNEELPMDYWVPLSEMMTLVAQFKVAMKTKDEQLKKLLKGLLEHYFEVSSVARISFEDRILNDYEPGATELYKYQV